MFNDMTIETQSFVHTVATLWREDKDQTCLQIKKTTDENVWHSYSRHICTFYLKNWISKLLDKITEAKR